MRKSRVNGKDRNLGRALSIQLVTRSRNHTRVVDVEASRVGNTSPAQPPTISHGDKPMPEDREFKETHTDEKSTVEYKDLKAETSHLRKPGEKSTFSREDTEDGYARKWEVSSNGDKIGEVNTSLTGVKKHLVDKYKDGQKRLGKKA